MLTIEQMKQQLDKYMIYLDVEEKQAFLIKHKGDVKISLERAIQWVEAGIDDLDCRSKDKMLTILNAWK